VLLLAIVISLSDDDLDDDGVTDALYEKEMIACLGVTCFELFMACTCPASEGAPPLDSLSEGRNASDAGYSLHAYLHQNSPDYDLASESGSGSGSGSISGCLSDTELDGCGTFTEIEYAADGCGLWGDDLWNDGSATKLNCSAIGLTQVPKFLKLTVTHAHVFHRDLHNNLITTLVVRIFKGLSNVETL
jgi:hypothetical protein